MDSDCGLGLRNLGYYKHPQALKIYQGLQLMPPTPPEQRDTKSMIFNPSFYYSGCRFPNTSSAPLAFGRECLMPHQGDKIQQVLPESHPNYAILSDVQIAHIPHMLQLEEPSRDDNPRQIDVPSGRKGTNAKKRSQGLSPKSPKPKKPKKTLAYGDEAGNGSVPSRRSPLKNTGIVINGIDLDISGIPAPMCSCTGTPQQCYRWGMGGWQSACCTTSISVYPLPMNTKRRGARIAGRKMSQGAFKKVLEKLFGDGYNLSNPIDLRTFWAKHGTNKFVIIR